MRKVIVSQFVSVDGVVQAPGGGDPHFKHEGRARCAPAGQADRRGLRDGLAGPRGRGRLRRPDQRDAEVRRLHDAANPEWQNSTVLDGDVAKAVAELKESDGGPILANGSPTLVRTLYENDLVDEYRLMVFPVRKLTLTETRTYANGVQLNILRATR